MSKTGFAAVLLSLTILTMSLCASASEPDRRDIPGMPQLTPQKEAGQCLITVTDADGNPLQGVYLNLCTDTFCKLLITDQSGQCAFEGGPEDFKVQILRVPEGYSGDVSPEAMTAWEDGGLVIVLQREAD